MASDADAEARRAAAGDISPDLTAEGIEHFEVGGAIDGAREAKVNAVRDVLANAQPEEMAAVARWLDAVLAGTSPDEFGVLRRVILEQDEPVYGTIPMSSDDELVDALAQRRVSLPQPHVAQGVRGPEVPPPGRAVEAAGVGEGLGPTSRHARSRAETRRARAARSSASWSTSTRAARASSRSRSRHRSSRASGTSSATCSTSRRAARSCSSTAPGTTGPASSGSWGSAPTTSSPSSCGRRRSSSAISRRSGVHLIKFWFSVSREEQRRRFREREKHPLKQWKLSPIDLASLDKWDEYTEAKKAMFVHTDTVEAPWTVIKSDCKKRARLNAIRYVLHKTAVHRQGRRPHRPARPAHRRARVRRVRDRRARSALIGLVETVSFVDVVLVETGRHAYVEPEYASEQRESVAASLGRDHPREVEVLAHVRPAVVDGQRVTGLVGPVQAAGVPGAGIEDHGASGARDDRLGIAVELVLRRPDRFARTNRAGSGSRRSASVKSVSAVSTPMLVG